MEKRHYGGNNTASKMIIMIIGDICEIWRILQLLPRSVKKKSENTEELITSYDKAKG